MLTWRRCTGYAAAAALLLPAHYSRAEQDALSQQHWAQVDMPRLRTGRGGQAQRLMLRSGLLQEARDSLRDCGAIAEEDGGWRAVWQAETEAASRARSSADQLREAVHFQVPLLLPCNFSQGSVAILSLHCAWWQKWVRVA